MLFCRNYYRAGTNTLEQQNLWKEKPYIQFLINFLEIIVSVYIANGGGDKIQQQRVRLGQRAEDVKAGKRRKWKTWL